MNFDYLVVGSGLAGLAFCKQALDEGKTLKVVDRDQGSASEVAAGVYNPVVLKRLNKVWKADVFLDTARPFYDDLQSFLKIEFKTDLPILRSIQSAEEQNDWYAASDKTELEPFLTPTILKKEIAGIKNTFGYGQVRQCGRVDTRALITAFKSYMAGAGMMEVNNFNHKKLQITHNGFVWQEELFSKLVFAEGFGLTDNPFFKYLPLVGNKGEYIKIKSDDLKLEHMLKAGIFLIPLDGNIYLAGATYNRHDLSPGPTEKARQELIVKLDKFLDSDYEIIDQTAGIRPTVPDRKPLIGEHPEHKNMYILNGMGSRGVLLAPYCASQLLDLSERQLPPEPEIDIKRFVRA